jgi:hypothetical protein
VRLNRKPLVRGLAIEGLSDAPLLCGETLHIVPVAYVLNHGVREDEVERTVRELKIAPISNDACINNPVELGDPIFTYHGVGIFLPFGALKLWVRYAGSPRISREARLDLWIAFGITIMGGFLAAGLAYWFSSIIRDRKSTENLQDLHGSAEWADEKTIKDTGLLTATDGVYVGAWREPKTKHLHYLLHAGPEPVLLFAPTRSGKGVFCIIPTLLQWRESAFVLDIKGENYDLTAGWRQSIGEFQKQHVRQRKWLVVGAPSSTKGKFPSGLRYSGLRLVKPGRRP